MLVRSGAFDSLFHLLVGRRLLSRVTCIMVHGDSFEVSELGPLACELVRGWHVNPGDMQVAQRQI